MQHMQFLFKGNHISYSEQWEQTAPRLTLGRHGAPTETREGKELGSPRQGKQLGSPRQWAL